MANKMNILLFFLGIQVAQEVFVEIHTTANVNAHEDGLINLLIPLAVVVPENPNLGLMLIEHRL